MSQGSGRCSKRYSSTAFVTSLSHWSLKLEGLNIERSFHFPKLQNCLPVATALTIFSSHCSLTAVMPRSAIQSNPGARSLSTRSFIFRTNATERLASSSSTYNNTTLCRRVVPSEIQLGVLKLEGLSVLSSFTHSKAFAIATARMIP